MLISGPAGAGGGPRNVVVVRNNRSKTSQDIVNYYIHARRIPPENVISLSCSTDEVVSKSECETNIVYPIRAFLQRPEFMNSIDYIVLTKGIPLAANYGYSSGPFAVTSILTCVSEFGVTSPITNPYGPTSPTPVETSFSHALSLGGKHLYLVTRLDAYTADDTYRMIDGSLAAGPFGVVTLDRRYLANGSPGSYISMNQLLTTANGILSSRGIPTFYDDTSAFVGNLKGLVGYFSWGSNDPSFSLTAYRSNLFNPGSIADTYVSTSARTLQQPSNAGQSLIADLVSQGACGLSGYVSEPYTTYCTHPDVLFDRYVKGYNMAESFYAATPELYWKSTVIGDPLMAPFATPPVVVIDSTGSPLNGVAAIGATATDQSGVSKIDFYFDGRYIGTSIKQPFSVMLDTTRYTVGPHLVEAVASENSPVATQSCGSATLTVQNPISNLTTISDAFPSPDGQGVRATAKVVTAGTMDLGGGEFYIQEENRSSGIRVLGNQLVKEGDLVTVTGDLVTDSGERSIIAAEVSVVNHLLTPEQPIGMSNAVVGGGDVSAQTKGVVGGVGLRNVGLLIRTWGKVTYSAEDFFYIDDGSALNDGSGHRGLKVTARSLVKPSTGMQVIVTGISGCEEVGGRMVRVVKVWKQSNIVSISR